ncbi:MAG: TldD/PmbA family protein [Candidatus Brocadiaceae bacterium]|jgi:TldD protein
MKDELLGLCQKLAADYVEIRLQEGVSTNIHYAGNELEDIGERTERGGCVRVLKDGGWGFATFNDLDELEKYAEMALRQAELVGGEKFGLAPLAPRQETYRTPVDTDPADVDLEEKQAMCRRYNDALLKHDRIQSTSVIYRDKHGTIRFGSSEGSYLEQEIVFSGAMVAAIAVDGTNIQRAYESNGDLRGFDKVAHMDEDCEKVARRALESLDARPVEAGTYTVIADPKLCGVFVHEAFGHLSESDFLYENPRLREIMEIGRRFGPDILNITDDGSLEGEAGFVPFDSEGVPGSRTPLIKEGVLTGRLHNRETAAKMGEEPTGNARAISYRHPPIVRMTNTFMEPGESTFEEILAATEDGIYAIGMLGGQTNMEMFTFSAEEAFRIRGGEIREKIRDVVLTGNVFQTLQNIDMIGDDFKMHGGLGGCGKGGQSPLRVGDGGPHCRMRNVVIGGR